MGTYFGQTMFGDEEYFKTNTRHAHESDIFSTPIQHFLQDFTKKAKDNCQTELIRRRCIPEIFTNVMGRELSLAEMEAVVRNFDLLKGLIHIDEFKSCLMQLQAEHYPSDEPPPLKDWDGHKEPPTPKHSNVQYCMDKRKHIRTVYSPYEVQNHPLTLNQEYGWDLEVRPLEKKEIWRGRRCTDVTKNEGICLDSYYGMF